MSANKVLHVGDLIASPTTQYRVQEYLGSGTYGIVCRCRNVSTDETVALKMIKSMAHIDFGEEERATLELMQELESDMFNIVRLKDSFTYKKHYCLVFEDLGIDLKTFMQSSPDQHLELKQIRPILQQLATSLEFLKSARIIHADLKPQNILMVDHVRQPLKIKVIDFGLACHNPKEQIGSVLQSLWYRSPEIVEKVAFNEAIDVWSLGCIAAELFMGKPLFSAMNEIHLMEQIESTTAKPRNKKGKENWFWPKHWMKTRFSKMPQLSLEVDDPAEQSDMECFPDLLKKMLLVNQSERITPEQILQHPFITMSHFEGPLQNSDYVKSCKDLMDICQDQRSGNGRRGDEIILIPNTDSSSGTAGTQQGSQRKSRRVDATHVGNPSKKRKKDAECDKRPNASQACLRRSERREATQIDSSGQTPPVKSQRTKRGVDVPPVGNPSKKGKIDAECGKRPDNSQANLRRSLRLEATQADSSRQIPPVESQRKRKGVDPTAGDKKN